VFACGFRIDAIELPLVGPMSMGIFALPVTIFWIVGIINAVNLIDGLDGLAGGIVFFAGITNFVVAYVTGSTFVASIMAAMLGSVLGFLFFNFNPARIFMGDSGSYFLGFLLGAMSLAGSSQKASTAVSILVPIVALGVPIFDTLFTMVRRFVERRPLFSADRGHVHHRLLDMGITHRRAVLILYGVSIVLTVAAIAVSLGRSWEVGVAILAASVVIIGLVRFLGYFEYLFVMRRQRARIRNADTEALRRALPEVLHALGAAANEATILNVLEALTQTAGLNAVELVTAQTSVEILRFFRQSTATSDQVSARYPVGEEHDARTHLRFRWQSSSGDVSPQTEVLLQVVVDTAAIALARVDSAFAPHVPARLQAERSSARRLSQTARAEG
jgi:UDP-GlcNAc:undecaprenyl-phosphate GlcNAc-1-phosphate transferase